MPFKSLLPPSVTATFDIKTTAQDSQRVYDMKDSDPQSRGFLLP